MLIGQPLSSSARLITACSTASGVEIIPPHRVTRANCKVPDQLRDEVKASSSPRPTEGFRRSPRARRRATDSDCSLEGLERIPSRRRRRRTKVNERAVWTFSPADFSLLLCTNPCPLDSVAVRFSRDRVRFAGLECSCVSKTKRSFQRERERWKRTDGEIVLGDQHSTAVFTLHQSLRIEIAFDEMTGERI